MDSYERPDDLGALEISITPPGRLTAERVEGYHGLGVHRLIANPRPGGDIGSVEETIAGAVEAVNGAGLPLD
jgi:hypothetical protein